MTANLDAAISGNTIAQLPSTSGDDEDSGLASLITQVKPPTEEEIAQQTKQKRPKIEVTPPSATQPLNPTPQSALLDSNSTRSEGKWKKLINSILCCIHQEEKKDSKIVKGKLSESPQIEKSTVDSPMLQITSTTPKQPIKKSSVSPVTSKKNAPEPKWLLPTLNSENVGKKCLVLDLDETLVHSSFKPVAHADYVIPVEIDNQVHNVYVLKRPGVDAFLQRLGSQFEVVIFTASLAKYADPVLDILDKYKVVEHRLFRESCLHHKGNYVKDLSQLGRELKDVIIIDNSPASYIFHPTNAIPITSWFHDPNDTELLDLIPFLEDLKMVENVMLVLDSSNDE